MKSEGPARNELLSQDVDAAVAELKTAAGAAGWCSRRLVASRALLISLHPCSIRWDILGIYFPDF